MDQNDEIIQDSCCLISLADEETHWCHVPYSSFPCRWMFVVISSTLSSSSFVACIPINNCLRSTVEYRCENSDSDTDKYLYVALFWSRSSLMIVDAAIDPSSCTLSVVAKSASLWGEIGRLIALRSGRPCCHPFEKWPSSVFSWRWYPNILETEAARLDMAWKYPSWMIGQGSKWVHDATSAYYRRAYPRLAPCQPLPIHTV